jgi:hypothetical protein
MGGGRRRVLLAEVFGLASTVLKAPAVMAAPAFPAWLWIGALDGSRAPWDSLNEGWTHVYDPRLMRHPVSTWAGSHAGGGLSGDVSEAAGAWRGRPLRRWWRWRRRWRRLTPGAPPSASLRARQRRRARP